MHVFVRWKRSWRIRMLVRALRMTITATLLFGSSSAWCYLLTDGVTNVGSEDALLGYGKLPNSGDQAQVDFVNFLTGENYVIDDQIGICSSEECEAIIHPTNGAGLFAIDLDEEPAHYLIKIGSGSSLTGTLMDNVNMVDYSCEPKAGPGPSTACTHFVYENKESLGWGVFRFSDLGFTVLNISKISHISRYGQGTTTRVPEPAALGLLGIGLLCAGLSRSRRLRSAA